jgi:hypothetical protein
VATARDLSVDLVEITAPALLFIALHRRSQ